MTVNFGVLCGWVCYFVSLVTVLFWVQLTASINLLLSSVDSPVIVQHGWVCLFLYIFDNCSAFKVLNIWVQVAGSINFLLSSVDSPIVLRGWVCLFLYICNNYSVLKVLKISGCAVQPQRTFCYLQ